MTGTRTLFWLAWVTYRIHANGKEELSALRGSDIPFSTATHPLNLASNVQRNEKPFPTGAWWTNLALAESNAPVYAMPYALKIIENELHISYPFRVVTPKAINSGFVSQIIVSFGETSRYEIVDYDAFSLTIRFSDTERHDTFCTAHLVRGSPYITLEYENMNMNLRAGGNTHWLKLKENENSEDLSFKSYRFLTSANQIWQLFVSDSAVELVLKEGSIGGTALLSGVLRIALTQNTYVQPILQNSAPVYPIGGSVEYTLASQDRMEMQIKWKVRSFDSEIQSSSLLMLALPHHEEILRIRNSKMANGTFEHDTNVLIEELSYACMKGIMKGVFGAVWYMEENLPTPNWHYKDEGLLNPGLVYDEHSLHSISSLFKLDTATVNTSHAHAVIKSHLIKVIASKLGEESRSKIPLAPDSYTFGKQVGRIAQLLLIAKQLNQTEIADDLLIQVKVALEPWLSGKNPDHFVYDQTYGGIVTWNGLHDHQADYGNGYYNDHHFHYGYIIYAVSVVRRYDPGFIAKHHSACMLLIADIGTPFDEQSIASLASPEMSWNFTKQFPVVRHKDWFSGHSYASGLFPMETGKSQESSSESINAYYALVLYASLSDNAQAHGKNGSYCDFARLLLAMELRSVKKYWHIPIDSKVYEPKFAQNAMVGVLGEFSVVYSTWFGTTPVFIHGINMIPFTPVTSILLLPQYVEYQYQKIESEYHALPATNIWKSAMCMDHAIIDAASAWKELSSIAAYDTWNSASNTMMWIATRDSWLKKETKENAGKQLQCFGYPKCDGLDCCNTLPGCCPGSLDCCPKRIYPSPSLYDQEEGKQMAMNACFGELQCGALNLACCESFDGCCDSVAVNQTIPECCKQKPSSFEHSHGRNSTSKRTHTNTSMRIFKLILLVLLGTIILYALAAYYRRRQYMPIERDLRGYYCVGALVVLIVLFVVLSITQFW